MKKADIVEAVYEMHGALSRNEVEDVVNLVLQNIRSALVKESRVKLHGFGTMEVVQRKGKKGVHPMSGEIVQIKPHRTVVFHASPKNWNEEGE